ncbi:MAG TPA: hypothetical protein VLZ30_07080 [Verrucomicrobiae bacterium]|nr:hypothetical protein [Verrucomicrobiae bacterium]
MNNLINRQFLSPAIKHAAAVSCVAMMLFSGCAGSGTTVRARTAAKPGNPVQQPSPAPLGPPAARIVSVNADLGFVVVDFGSLTVPTPGTQVSIYHGGKRVGVVRITEPVHAPLATADVVEGEVRMGDEAR